MAGTLWAIGSVAAAVAGLGASIVPASAAPPSPLADIPAQVAEAVPRAVAAVGPSDGLSRWAVVVLSRWAVVVLSRQVLVPYAEPVDAPVIDRFRPPSTPYGPGNRGWEYATEAGGVVRAAADGIVTFAGTVGGSTAVTISHADGLRTSYSYLTATSIRTGDRIRLGDPVGQSGARLHFGVRRGEVYLDPVVLFAPPAVRRVRLVPLSAS